MDITSLNQIAYGYNPADSATKQVSDSTANASAKNPVEEARQQGEVAKLKASEREVIAHEQAHSAVGGRFAGAVTYSYTTGPDGKSYITGGEVSISMPSGRTPEETAQNMRQVKAAALAPANPSSADIAVAARASALEARALNEASQKEVSKSDDSSLASEVDDEVLDPARSKSLIESYSSSTAKEGSTPGSILSLLV